MMGQVYGLDEDGVRKVREISRRVLNDSINDRPKRARWPVGGVAGSQLVLLNEDLAACSNPLTDPAPSADAEILKAGGSGRVMSGTVIEVFNLGNVAFDADTLGYTKMLAGVLQFVPLDCPSDEDE